ncbi:hypothetical protein [Streptosporangium sp. NPDC023615]|uniref:hypothetical protein n=1 Tax=Streptosporangium sp. NPDC023615 TaxID=3154794 RepID=UPI00342AD5C7
MRRHLTALAALALAGGVLLTPGSASAAAPAAAPQGTAAHAGKPLSPLRLTAYFPRGAWAGDAYVYTLKIKNVGKWYTDIAYVEGVLPRQASGVRIVGRPAGSRCEVSGRRMGCFLDTLNPGRSATVKVKVWLRNSASGTATAEFGSTSIDVPAGGLGTFDVHGIDITGDVKYVKVRTRIHR